MQTLVMTLIQMEGFGPGRMWFLPIICIAICVIVFAVFRKGGGGPFFSDRRGHMDNPNTEKSSAMDILNSRYAKGEINKEEYDRMKKDIS